jgi:hypothetical protein
MISRSGIASIAIIGIIVLAFTIAAFFLLEIERVAVFLWALAFLLLSEIVLFAGLVCVRQYSVRHSNVFLKTGATTALMLYFAATLILTLFAGAMRERLNIFILIGIGVIALFAIATIAILSTARGIAHRNEQDMSKVGSNEPKRGGF